MRLVAFDFETYKIQPYDPTPKIVCGVFASPQVELYLREQALDLLTKLLCDPEVILVGANVAFDFGCALKARPELFPLLFKAYNESRVWDVLCAQKLLDNEMSELGIMYRSASDDPEDEETLDRIAHGYNLADVAFKTLGVQMGDKITYKEGDELKGKGDADTWRLRYALLDGLALEYWPEAAKRYLALDGDLPLRVAEWQRQQEAHNLSLVPALCRTAFALALDGIVGVRSTASAVARFEAQVEVSYAAYLEEAQRNGFVRKDGTKNMNAIKSAVASAFGGFLCSTCGDKWKPKRKSDPPLCPTCWGKESELKDVPLTDKGQVCTSSDVLRESGDEKLEALATPVLKLRSTFLPLVKTGLYHAIHPHWSEFKKTGRTGCGGPNLQQLPRKGAVRECFRPPPGRVFSSEDYSTLELCTLAQTTYSWFGHSKMLELINQGIDLHAYFAAHVLHVDYDVFKKEMKKNPQYKEYRQMSKAPNFGLPGLLGAFALVSYARNNYDVSFCKLEGGTKCRERLVTNKKGERACADCLDVAGSIRAAWFDLFCEVTEYHQVITVAVKDPHNLGRVQIANGGLVRANCGASSGANFPFQGLAAQLATDAHWHVSQEMYCDPESVLYGSHAHIFAHDEIIASHPVEIAAECAERVSQIMVARGRLALPDVTGLKAEPTLMTRWAKGAECIRDENGRLLANAECPKCHRWGAVDWDGHMREHGKCEYRGLTTDEDLCSLFGSKAERVDREIQTG